MPDFYLCPKCITFVKLITCITLSLFASFCSRFSKIRGSKHKIKHLSKDPDPVEERDPTTLLKPGSGEAGGALRSIAGSLPGLTLCANPACDF